MTFRAAMRLVAALLCLGAAGELIAMHHLYPVPFGVAAALLLSSFAAERAPRPIAAVVASIAVLVPPYATWAWSRGSLNGGAVLFDWALFSWLLWRARQHWSRHAPDKGSSYP